MPTPSLAEPLDPWIALPLHDVPKTELKELGVPAALVKAVRAVTTADELRALALEPELLRRLEARLAQRLAAARGRGGPPRHLHVAFDRQHLADLRDELVELLVALDPRQQEVVDRVLAGGALRIRGVAGSGKTQVLLHALAKRAYRSAQVSDLLWTFNRSLIEWAGVLLGRLAGPRARRATLSTFDGWCLRRVDRPGRVLGDDASELLALVRRARDRAREATGDPGSKLWQRDVDFWREELAFIRDQPIEALADYLDVERVGRGTRLDRAHRPLVWAVHEHYARLLRESGLNDWRQVRLEAYRKLVATRASRYDHVFIDEAQDLPPLALKMAGLLAGENVTVALDGSQAIYRKGFRWRDLGLGQARTTTLATCYRTTVQIARAAERFRAREEDPIAWDVERAGPKPRVVDVARPALEAEWVAEEVVRRLTAGELRPGHVAVLCYQRGLVPKVAFRLRQRGLQATEGAHDLSDETVKVLTMSSAKGLEFPVVYIAPLQDGDFFPRQGGQDADEHQLEVERRLRVLYVAMTRARDELVLVHRAGKAARVIASMNPDRFEHERGAVP